MIRFVNVASVMKYARPTHYDKWLFFNDVMFQEHLQL